MCTLRVHGQQVLPYSADQQLVVVSNGVNDHTLRLRFICEQEIHQDVFHLDDTVECVFACSVCSIH